MLRNFTAAVAMGLARSRSACALHQDLAMMTNGLPVNYNGHSWLVVANLSQYLYVKDDAEAVAQKLKSGQPLNGIGVFVRAGYAPQDSNPVTRDASVALVAHGLFDARAYDSFEVAYYYNAISIDLKNDITVLTAGMATARNESGMEAFYDFPITPASDPDLSAHLEPLGC